MLANSKRDAGPRRQPVQVGAQRRFQSQQIEGRGPQIERQAAHLLDGPIHDLHAFLQARQAGGIHTRAEGFEVQVNAGEHLADLVMQLAREVVPFLLLGLDQPPRQERQHLLVGLHLAVQAVALRLGALPLRDIPRHADEAARLPVNIP